MRRILVHVGGVVLLGVFYQFLKDVLGGPLFTVSALAYLMLLKWLGNRVERSRAGGFASE
jgi:hypothetical protein